MLTVEIKRRIISKLEISLNILIILKKTNSRIKDNFCLFIEADEILHK